MGLGIIQGKIQLIDEWTPTINMAMDSMNRMGRFQRQWGMNLSLFGAAMTTAVTVPLTGLIKIAADFQHQFANIVKTVEGLDVDSFGRLNSAAKEFRQTIRDLATDLPFTHKQLSEIAAFGGQFGVDLKDLGKFTETVAKLGTAVDGIETETAAKGLAQIISITTPGAISENIEKLSSELVHLGNTGISTEGTILEITRRMAGAGKTAGMSAKFMMGLSAAVANLGHRAELGGTALSNTILKIDRSVSKGGDALKDFAKVAQMSSQEFASAWGQNSEKTLMHLFDRLAHLNPKNLSNVVSELFGTAARQNQVLLSLISAYPLLIKTIQEGNKAFEEGTALQEEFRKKAVTFWNQLEVVKNRFYDIALTIGGPFLEALTNALTYVDPLIEKLKTMAMAFEDMDPFFQKIVIGFTLFAAIIPPVISVLGVLSWTFGQFFGTVSGALGILKSFLPELVALETGTAKLSYVFSGFRLVLTSLVTPIAQFLQGIINGIKATYEFWGVFGKVNSAVWSFFDALANMTFVRFFASLVEGATMAMNGFMLALAGVAMALGVGALLTDLRDFMVWLGIIPGRVEGNVSTLESFRNVIRDIADAFNVLNQKAKHFIDYIFKPFSKEGALFGPLSVPVRAAKYFIGENVSKKDLVDPFDLKIKKDITREAFADRKPYEPINPADLNKDVLKKYPSHFTMITETDQKNFEYSKTMWGQLRNNLVDLGDDAKKTKTAMKALNEEFERAWKFEQFLGVDSLQTYTEMAVALEKMNNLGMKPSTDFVTKMSEAAIGAIEYLKRIGVAVDESFYKAAKAANLLKIELGGLQKDSIKGIETGPEYWKEVSKGIEEASKKIREVELKINQQKWSNRIAQESDKTTKALLEVAKEYDALKASFADSAELGVPAKLLKELQDEQLEGLRIKFNEVVQKSAEFRAAMMAMSAINPALMGMVISGLEGTEDKSNKKKFGESFKESVNDLGKAFSRLSNIMGDSFDGVLKKIGDIVALMQVGVEVGETLSEVFTKTTVNADGTKSKKFDLSTLQGKNGTGAALEGYIKGFSAVVQGYSLMQQATDVKGRGNRMMGGAMTGASIGSAFGPWGTVIGFVVGAIWGAFRKLKWEEIGNRIAHRFGSEVSEKLSRAIADTAKAKFGGDMLTAEISHIGDIIKEIGVTEDNFAKLAWGIRDIFVMLDMGRFTLEQAATALDSSFSQMLEVGTNKMGFIRKELREIISLTYEWGVNSKEVLKFMGEQADSLLEAVGALAVMPAKYELWISIGEKIQEARDAIAEAADDADKLAKANEDLNKALEEQTAMANAAQSELETLGLVIAGNVFAAVADGRTLADAIMDAKDGLKDFFEAYKSLGLSPQDPLVRLLQIQSDLGDKIPNTLAGVGALGQSIVGLTNMNLLDAPMFDTLQQAAFNAYTSIQSEVYALGGSTRDALLPMQSYLQQAEYAARNLGIPLDDNTKMLIEQSKELGIWKELGPSAAELMTSAIGNLVDKISLLIDRMFDIPSSLPDPFANWTDPGQVILPGEEYLPPSERSNRAVGSIVSSGKWFEDWGAGTPVTLHNKEAVIRPDQALPFAAHVLSSYYGDVNPKQSSTTAFDMPSNSGGSGSSGSGSTVPVILRVKNRDILTEVVLEGADDFLAGRGVRKN